MFVIRSGKRFWRVGKGISVGESLATRIPTREEARRIIEDTRQVYEGMGESPDKVLWQHAEVIPWVDRLQPVADGYSSHTYGGNPHGPRCLGAFINGVCNVCNLLMMYRPL